MTTSTFVTQIDRFKIKWPRAFDPESTKLIWREVSNQEDQWFIYLTDRFIGNRRVSDPPMLEDFRQAVLRSAQRTFNKQVEQAAEAMNHPAKNDGLKRILEKYYPGCKTLMEAVEVERLRIRLARANGEPDPGPIDGSAP